MHKSISILYMLTCSLFIGTIVDAQDGNTPSCASKLIPCSEYMNVTKPPESCCKPLKETIETQLECLCNIYSSPGFLASFGINVTEAVTLNTRCGIPGDLSACGKAQSPRSTTTQAGTDRNGDGRRRIIASANVLSVVMFLYVFMLF